MDDDDDDDGDGDELASDATSPLRSARASDAPTPSAPTVTASGRQVRSRAAGRYGESLLSGQTTAARATPATDDFVDADAHPRAAAAASGRATRTRARQAAAPNGWAAGARAHIETYNELDEMDDEDEAELSGAEWDGGDDADGGSPVDDDDDDDAGSDAQSPPGRAPKQLVAVLRLGHGAKRALLALAQPDAAPLANGVPAASDSLAGAASAPDGAAVKLYGAASGPPPAPAPAPLAPPALSDAAPADRAAS